MRGKIYKGKGNQPLSSSTGIDNLLELTILDKVVNSRGDV